MQQRNFIIVIVALLSAEFSLCHELTGSTLSILYRLAVSLPPNRLAEETPRETLSFVAMAKRGLFVGEVCFGVLYEVTGPI